MLQLLTDLLFCCSVEKLFDLLAWYKVYPVCRASGGLMMSIRPGDTWRDHVHRIQRWSAWLAGQVDELQRAWDARFDPANELPHVFHRLVTGSIDSFPIIINRPSAPGVQRRFYSGKYKQHVAKVRLLQLVSKCTILYQIVSADDRSVVLLYSVVGAGHLQPTGLHHVVLGYARGHAVRHHALPSVRACHGTGRADLGRQGILQRARSAPRGAVQAAAGPSCTLAAQGCVQRCARLVPQHHRALLRLHQAVSAPAATACSSLQHFATNCIKLHQLTTVVVICRYAIIGGKYRGRYHANPHHLDNALKVIIHISSAYTQAHRQRVLRVIPGVPPAPRPPRLPAIDNSRVDTGNTLAHMRLGQQVQVWWSPAESWWPAEVKRKLMREGKVLLDLVGLGEKKMLPRHVRL
jgi:hypothetical protein